MKVALVHDYIKEYGGAERVLEVLHEIYPEADVFTSIYCPQYLGPHRDRFTNWNIKTSFLQQIPFKEKLISPFRLISLWVFKNFDFSGYDLIIVSATGAYFPNALKKRNARHVCYCHTPPRYLYGYKTARDWERNIISKIVGSIVNHFLRMLDFNSAQNVDLFIANSKEVKERIWKFYRKDAVVVYPPVTAGISKTEYRIPKGKKDSYPINNIPHSIYYLTGGRLARAKRVDLAVEACTKLKVQLKVFGKSFAGYGDELKEMAGDKVEFLGEVTEEKKLELMAGARAFIFPSDTEDFGITPVEAMMVGTPVIAYKSGGVLETVVEGETGVFFTELNADSLVDAVRKADKIKWNKNMIINDAERFSKAKFVKQIKMYC